MLGVGTVNNGVVVQSDGDGHFIYDHNAYSTHTVVRSPEPLPAGAIVLEVHQERVRRGPARARLLINGEQVAEAIIPLVPVMISSIGMDIGRHPTGVAARPDAPSAARLCRRDGATTPAPRHPASAAPDTPAPAATP